MKWRALHRDCEAREYDLLRERDKLEGELGRLRRAHDDLLAAYQALVAHTASNQQSDVFAGMLKEMFTEEPGEPTFLTPSLEEREGVERA